MTAQEFFVRYHAARVVIEDATARQLRAEREIRENWKQKVEEIFYRSVMSGSR